MTKYVNNNGVSEMWLNIKNWVTSQLLGYSQTGHTHTKSQITDLDLNNYLPLRGGTLSGSISFSGTCYTSVGTGKELSSDRYVITTTRGANLGGSLYLYGGDFENSWGEKGNFRLVAQSKEKGSKYLLGTPSGSLTWNGKELATQEYVNTNYSQTGHTHTKSQITDLDLSNYADKTSNQTVGGNKEFTGTTTAHDVIPSATETYNLGSPSYQWNNAYIKSLTINGVACGDILTHNASEFVGVSGNQTISGIKTFSSEVTMFGRDINLMSRTHYGKNSNPSTTSWQYLYFRGNTAHEGYTNAWYGGYLEQVINTNGSARGRWFIRDTSESNLGIELFVNGSNKYVKPTENNAVNLGTSTNKWKDVQTEKINGLAMGDILTHNVSEFASVGHTHSISDITDLETWNYDPNSDSIIVSGGTDTWSYDSQSNSIIVS